MKHPAPLFLLAACLAALPNPSSAAPDFSWTTDQDQLRLQEQGRDVLTFQLSPRSIDGKYPRANYVHPLFHVDGTVVTEDFPADHVHHRGIFWSWHQLLLNGTSVADPWFCDRLEWRIPENNRPHVNTTITTTHATMEVVRDWVVPDPDSSETELRIVRESVGIKVLPARNQTRILDFDLRFRALVEGVTLGGSDDVKGYGGFSPRVRLAEDVRFTGQKGVIKPQNAAVDGGPWLDVTGTIDGRVRGVAMIVHPSHPGFPLKWILRSQRSMQNPQWPGRKPVPVPTTTDLRLRYRLVLHPDQPDPEELDRLWKEFGDS